MLHVDVGEHLSVGLLGVLAEVRREVGDPFEIGDDLERGGDETQIARDRLLEGDEVRTLPLQFEVEIVDLPRRR